MAQGVIIANPVLQEIQGLASSLVAIREHQIRQDEAQTRQNKIMIGGFMIIAAAVVVAMFGGVFPTNHLDQEADHGQRWNMQSIPIWDEKVYEVYAFKAHRHLVIKAHLKDRIPPCEVEHKKYRNETEALSLNLTEQVMVNRGFEDGIDADEGKRLRKIEEDVKEREMEEEIMEERLARLKQWTTRKELAKLAMPDTFDWKKLLKDHGICRDRNECFCDILLGPAEEMEKMLAKNEEDVAKADVIINTGDPKLKKEEKDEN